MRRCWRRRPNTCCSFHTAALQASSAGGGRERDEIKLQVKAQLDHAQEENMRSQHLA